MADAEVEDCVLHPVLRGESRPGDLPQHSLGSEGVEDAVIALEHLQLVKIQVHQRGIAGVESELALLSNGVSGLDGN